MRVISHPKLQSLEARSEIKIPCICIQVLILCQYSPEQMRLANKLGTNRVFTHCAVFSHSIMFDSLKLHGVQPARLLCPWGFSRQEYWSGLPCLPPGDLPNPGIEPRYPALQTDSLPSEPPGKPVFTYSIYNSRDLGLIPGSGRCPGEGNGNPVQYSCLNNSMDRGAWQAAVSGVTKSGTRLK